MTLVESFRSQVIDTFGYTVVGGTTLSYADYLALPAAVRAGDEASVVDSLLTPRILEWLGYNVGSDYTYNDPRAIGAGSRPDFLIHNGGTVLFIWEDKNTTESFGIEWVPQLQRYTAGTNGYAVWSNGQELLLLRFEPSGEYEVHVAVDLVSLFVTGQGSLFEAAAASLELFHQLLNRGRFTEFDSILGSIAIPLDEWHPIPLSIENALPRFIEGSRTALDGLTAAAATAIQFAIMESGRHRASIDEIKARIGAANEQLIAAAPSTLRESLRTALAELRERLGTWNSGDLSTAITSFASALPTTAVLNWRRSMAAMDVRQRQLLVRRAKTIQISEAFQIWRARQPEPPKATPRAFAEQVAYVYFVRLILARILEDKGIIPNRIISDGGLAAWRRLITEHFRTVTGHINGDVLLMMLFRDISTYYQHFFQQPVFDWFSPDDYLLVVVLRHLNSYDFSEVTSDVLGYTYENYIDRANRNKKGHFLTRPQLVSFILDEAGYVDDAILGRSILDPACGSGSFLIQAARRLRTATIHATQRHFGLDAEQLREAFAKPDSEERLYFSRRYVEAVEDSLHGMEIDPFACYLSELNLLVQVLDELHYLWQHGVRRHIDRFRILATDSLDLPVEIQGSTSVAHQQSFATAAAGLAEGGLADPGAGTGDLGIDADLAFAVKAKVGYAANGFSYIVSNPPYVASKRQEMAQDLQAIPFFAEAFSGSTNLYLAFLRLAQYYAAAGGRLAFVVPLTLIADDSADAMRRRLNSSGWRVVSVTRFYDALVLFEGVDQQVCVVVAEQRESGVDTAVMLRGGRDVTSAGSRVLSVSHDALTAYVPRISTDVAAQLTALADFRPWRGPWIVAPEREVFEVWDTIARSNSHPLGLLSLGVVTSAQGDVNATYIKPQRISQHEDGSVPLFRGKDVRPFACIRAPSQWARLESSANLNANQRRARTEVLRIASLDHEEAGFVLQAIANTPIRDRVRGTWFKRSAANPLVFQHHLWRFVAETGKERAAKALFGLLTSKLVQYCYGLFSTNPNLNKSVLFRIPTPPSETFPVAAVATAVDEALAAQQSFDEQIERYGSRWDAESGHIAIDVSRVRNAPGIAYIRLQDAFDRGLLSLPQTTAAAMGRQRVAVVLERLETSTPAAGFDAAVRRVLGGQPRLRFADVMGCVVPEPDHAAAWLKHIESIEAEVEESRQRALQARTDIDACTFEWYAINDERLRTIIMSGLPWVYGNRDEAGETEGPEEED